jgi:hypothetical protein
MTPEQREFFEERAAIREFDGGASRDDAERGAWQDTVRFFEMEYVDTRPVVVNAVQWFKMGDHPDVVADTMVPGQGRLPVFGRGMAAIRPGAWVVTWRNGQHGVFSDAAFKRRFAKREAPVST